MKINLLLFFIIVFFINCQTNKQIIVNNSPWLWKISKKGHQTSYLFGTIHAGVSGRHLPLNVNNAFNNSTILLTEAELTNTEQKVGDFIKNTSKECLNLDKKLNPIAWKYWRENLLKDQLSEEKIKCLHPVVYLFINMNKQFEKCEICKKVPKNEGLDIWLQNIAKNIHKKQEYLETIEYQLSMFDKAYSIQNLNQISEIDYLKLEKSSIDNLDKVINLYQSGNIKDITENSELINKTMPDLLYERNKNWVVTVDECTKQNSCFVAVGLAHLTGKNSLTDLLKQKGYVIDGNN